VFFPWYLSSQMAFHAQKCYEHQNPCTLLGL
jgi:hypothetical protein